MKKLLILSLCFSLMGNASHCSVMNRLAKIGAAFGIGSDPIPDKFKPRETWLYPNTLFHGSMHKDIEIIKPKTLGTRCKGRPIVFASHHIALASLFMLKHHGKFACGRLPDGNIFYITDNKRQCILDDQPGAIYVVPAESFFCEAHVSLGVDEWISYGAIKPLAKFVFQSALDAILDFGVKVYFVDSTTYARYWRLSSSNDEWSAFFKPLASLTKAQLVSERTVLMR